MCQKTIDKYKNVKPKKTQHPIYIPHPIKYGKLLQAPEPIYDSSPASAADKNLLQHIIGSFLYSGWAINTTVQMALSKLVGAQANPTHNNMKKAKQLLESMVTHPDSSIR